ncbi:PEP-CTERM sorting domain-containing protein [Pseudaquabacterium pictum]|uniref:PEP-CTERM protein-sorting domain-containing protein n=1 Tax=Pseudaquabacterium pictum TaxID=2315236 RepID=A0A480AVJ0_9BURK|nr:PEP-CTERM sorting domain-containing protein [Rubrivivax pictus]GCL65353.1 hypothetical protein AQPW35_44340 [Rubrivivax pictus]
MPLPCLPPALRRHTARWTLAACALAAGLGIGATAQAAASASAQVSNLTLTLVDLDPDDGLEAQVAWADGRTLVTGQLDGLPGGAPGPGFALALSQAFATLADQRTVWPGGFAAAQSGPPHLVAHGSSGDGASFSANASSGYGLLGGGLVLGAGSGLRLSLDYVLQASVDGRDSGCASCDTAQAQLVVVLGLGQDMPLTAPFSVLADTGLELFSDSLADSLVLQWDNTSGEDQTLGLGVTLSASGFATSAAPVPEPAAALLLCGGLGLLAALRRVRHRAG